MKKYKTNFYPQKLGEILFVIGVILFVSFGFIRKVADDQSIFLQLAWLSAFGAAMAVTVAIIFGFRAIRYYGFTKKRLVAPIIGILGALMFSSMGFISSYVINDMLEMHFSIKTKMENILSDESVSLARRSLTSRMYASHQYIEKGKAIEYFTEEGLKKLFSPTQDDIEMFNEFGRIRVMKMNLLYSGYAWLGLLFVSLLLAFFTPVTKKRLH